MATIAAAPLVRPPDCGRQAARASRPENHLTHAFPALPWNEVNPPRVVPVETPIPRLAPSCRPSYPLDVPPVYPRDRFRDRVRAQTFSALSVGVADHGAHTEPGGP